MHQAERIREALSKVDVLRQSTRHSTELATSVSNVKALQARRFAGTYADLAADERYESATRFFLQELYGARDFTARDTQFFRVAGTLERMLPRQAVETATMLAELHFLSEDLDYCMARTSLDGSLNIEDIDLATANYIQAWRTVGRREDRHMQLQMVLSLGRALVRLTSAPGLRLLLRMMRTPASAAGLGSLQHFLEAGFDTFASMNSKEGRTDYFLETIEGRESEFMRLLFDDSINCCQAEMKEKLRRGF
jgi:hypothetical protein